MLTIQTDFIPSELSSSDKARGTLCCFVLCS